MKQEKKQILDRPVFFISIAVILVLVVLLFVAPQKTTDAMVATNHFIVNNLGFVYTWAGIASVLAVLYFSFSRYGKIKFGDPGEKPEYSEFTWAATMFTAGNAAALIYWAPLEWIYYYQDPALGIEPLSWQAAEWSGAYTFFHWGVIPWSLYVISALPIAYCYFVRKTPVLKVSETCRDVLGKHSDGALGKLFDILFIVAMIMGTTTEIGIAVPFVSTAICTVCGTEVNITWMLAVMIVTTVLFSVAAVIGLKKGVAKLGNATSVLGIGILIYILVFGPTLFIIKMATTSTGLFAQNFVRMATWMDPVLNGGFAEAWTQFYWAWWMSASLFMGLFIARLSRGRTVRRVLLGSVGYGSLGAGAFFWVFSGFTMDLQLHGKFDFIGAVNELGTSGGIMAALKQLPLGIVIIAACAICGVMFLATTYDASATSIAAVSQRQIHAGEDPDKRNVLAWSILMVLIPAGILVADGPFEALQATTIAGSFPVTFIIIVEMIAFVKMVKRDQGLG